MIHVNAILKKALIDLLELYLNTVIILRGLEIYKAKINNKDLDMKLLPAVLLSLALGATASFAQKTYTIKFAHVVAAQTPKGKAADFFAKRAEELSNGQIKVQVFPSAQLVDDDRVFSSLKLNTVQMAAPSFSKFTPIIPQFELFDMPFIFRDIKHLHDVEDGSVGDKLKKLIEAKGYVALSYWDAGFKHFSSSKKPIVNPEDAKGQKFRIMTSKVLEAQTKAIGGNAQVLPFSEVYSALQQGVVDAAENPLSNFYNSKFYEVQTSLTLSEHGYLGYLVIVGEKFWKGLPDDMKKIVIQAMDEATEYERNLSAEEDAKIIAHLEEYAKNTNKLKIIRLTPEQRDAWSKLMKGIYPEFYKLIGKDLIEETINTK